MRSLVALWVALGTAGCSHMQQAGDLSFEPVVEHPAYPGGEGPRVLIDGSHCNFHTVDGRYAPFADLLRRDGFTVAALDGGFTTAGLAEADVVVIANAMPEARCDVWKLPIDAAFAAAEVAALEGWVQAGGSVLLIADHMPFPGAAEELAAAFGLVFMNGYARPEEGSRIRFERGTGGLGEHAILEGRTDSERIDAVVSFTGQAFRALGEIDALLTLPAGVTMRLPRKAGKFSAKTPAFSAEGLLQGAVFEHGEGRVAVFGEAAMFSAQEYVRDGELRQMGMNAPGAEQNAQFTLNLMHWLAGLLEP